MKEIMVETIDTWSLCQFVNYSYLGEQASVICNWNTANSVKSLQRNQSLQKWGANAVRASSL